jgi:hypothetical protein
MWEDSSAPSRLRAMRRKSWMFMFSACYDDFILAAGAPAV